jgi:HAD superfamily hydrolase (TIGR01484 family)
VKPLSQLTASQLAQCRGLLFDIDDTLTSHGVLKADAYAALERLQTAGKQCIAVTGRPAGWCDLIARFWPVDAVVGENGAFYMRKNAAKLETVWAGEQPDITSHRACLGAIAQGIMSAVPGCAMASDQAYRLCDLAIDFCEDVSPLPLSSAQRIAALMTAAGMTAKISSIHVNGWFGAHDKLSTTLQLLAQHYGQDAATAQRSWVYIGDSPNDAPMFAAFEHSVGVANVAAFGDLLPAKPQFITRSDSGAGFVELVNHWLGQP